MLHELRRVLPDYLGTGSDAQLRLPQPRIMALVPPEAVPGELFTTMTSPKNEEKRGASHGSIRGTEVAIVVIGEPPW